MCKLSQSLRATSVPEMNYKLYPGSIPSILRRKGAEGMVIIGGSLEQDYDQYNMYGYVLEGYAVRSLSLEYQHSCYTLMGDHFPTEVNTGQKLSIELHSVGKVRTLAPEDVLNLHKGMLDNFSIDDLLKAIYDKMEDRQSEVKSKSPKQLPSCTDS